MPLCLLVAGCNQRARPGEPAPDFHVTTADGRSVSLESYRGRVLVLNFWATYCIPCVEETPSLNRLQQQFPNRSVEVLAISVDPNDADYRRFLTSNKVIFATAHADTWQLPWRYGTVKIPETYIIDRDGKVTRKLVDEQNWIAPEFVTYLRDLARAPAS